MTYSIIALDPATGMVGVGVQTHYFAVGRLVPWAEAGVGAVATQAFVNPDYGPGGLDAMRQGMDPGEALAKLLEQDEGRDSRQVAMLNTEGVGAVHTGTACLAAAGHRCGDGYSVQGNMLRSDKSFDAMAEAYDRAEGVLAERLLQALEAGELAGGDARGRQSAALLVVSGDKQSRRWHGVELDLRVDDHPMPLLELRRLYDVHRSYGAMRDATSAVAEDDLKLALRHLAEAERLCPDNPEFAFWVALRMVASHEQQAYELLQSVFKTEPGFRDLLQSMPGSGMLPEDPALVARLLR